MVNDGEHLSMSINYLSSFHIFWHFLIEVIFYCRYLRVVYVCYNSTYSSFVGYVACKYLLPDCSLSFYSLTGSLRAKFLWDPIYQFFHLTIMLLVSSLRIFLLAPGLKSFLLNVLFYLLIFKYVVHFEFILV